MKLFRSLFVSCIGVAVVSVMPAFAFAQSDAIEFDKKVCEQTKKERDALLDETELEQFVVRRIEFYGNRYIRDRVLRDQLVFEEGDMFYRKDLKKSLERISRMKAFGRLTMNNVKVLLDKAGRKNIDFIFCVTERPKQ